MGQRVIFKTADPVWKCIHGVAPVYLQELCTQVDNIRARSRLYGLRHLAASSYQECTQCASEMTYIVSSGALSSTPTNQANVCCITELCLQWAGSVEQSVSNTARQWCVTTHIQAATLQHDEHHSALLRRFCEAPLYKTLDLLTCLLLASWGSRIVILGDPSLPVRSRPSILLVATASVKPRTMCSH